MDRGRNPFVHETQFGIIMHQFLFAGQHQTFSALFSLYVDNFNRYTNIYGSVYAVALAMLWLYMCVSIVFYGAVLNRLLKEYGKM